MYHPHQENPSSASSPSSPSATLSLSHPGLQSITEVLQDPRPNLDPTSLLRATTSVPSSSSPSAQESGVVEEGEKININDFEKYLRLVNSSFYDRGRRRKGGLMMRVRNQVTGDEDEDGHRLENFQQVVPKEYFEEGFCPINAPVVEQALQNDGKGVTSEERRKEVKANLDGHLDTLHRALCETLKRNASHIDTALARVSALYARASSLDAQLSLAREKALSQIKQTTKVPLQVARKRCEKRNADAVVKGLENALRIIHVEDVVRVMLDAMEFGGVLEVLKEAVDSLWDEPLGRVEALDKERKRVLDESRIVRQRLNLEFRTLVAEGCLEEVKAVVKLAEELEDILEVTQDGRKDASVREQHGKMYLEEEKVNLRKELKRDRELDYIRKTSVERAKNAEKVFRVLSDKGDGGGLAEDIVIGLKRELCEAVQDLLGEFVKSQYNDKKFDQVISLGGVEALLKFGSRMCDVAAIAADVENILNVSNVGVIRATIAERSLKFLEMIYQSHVRRLKQSIEEEKWVQVKVSASVQATVDEMIDLCEQHHKIPIRGHGKKSASAEHDNSCLRIGLEKFLVTRCMLQYVCSMHLFVFFSKDMTLVGPEAARRATELMRLFNSLTGKAILNAAALKTAGLRSITARHIALSSRSVAAALALSPHIKMCLMAAARREQKELIETKIDHIDRDLRIHHEQLLSKILSIMMDRLKTHIGALKAIKWHDPAPPKPAGENSRTPSTYMLSLVKETTVLHKIVWGILLNEEVASIYGRMCAAYGSRLSDAWGSLDGFKGSVRERVRLDVEYMYSNLRKLAIFEFDAVALRPIERLRKRFALNENMPNRASLNTREDGAVKQDAGGRSEDEGKGVRDMSEQSGKLALDKADSKREGERPELVTRAPEISEENERKKEKDINNADPSHGGPSIAVFGKNLAPSTTANQTNAPTLSAAGVKFEFTSGVSASRDRKALTSCGEVCAEEKSETEEQSHGIEQKLNHLINGGQLPSTPTGRQFKFRDFNYEGHTTFLDCSESSARPSTERALENGDAGGESLDKIDIGNIDVEVSVSDEDEERVFDL